MIETIFIVLTAFLAAATIFLIIGPHKIVRCISCKKFKSLNLIYAYDQGLDTNLYEMGRRTSENGSHFQVLEKRLFCKRCRFTDKLTR